MAAALASMAADRIGGWRRNANRRHNVAKKSMKIEKQRNIAKTAKNIAMAGGGVMYGRA